MGPKLAATDPSSVQEEFCKHAHVWSHIQVSSDSSRWLSVELLHLLVLVALACAAARAGLLAASVQQGQVVLHVCVLRSVSLGCFFVAHASSCCGCCALLRYLFLTLLLPSACAGMWSCYLPAMLSCFLFFASCPLPFFLLPPLLMASNWMERGPVLGPDLPPPPTCTQHAKGPTFGSKIWGHFFGGLRGPAPGRRLASNTLLALEEALFG